MLTSKHEQSAVGRTRRHLSDRQIPSRDTSAQRPLRFRSREARRAAKAAAMGSRWPATHANASSVNANRSPIPMHCPRPTNDNTTTRPIRTQEQTPHAPRPYPAPPIHAITHPMNPDLSEPERARIEAKTALFDPPAMVLPDGRRDLVGLSRPELAAELAEIGQPEFRAKQLWHWIYHRGQTDFAAMTSLGRALQTTLAERFVVARPDPATVQTSTDDTRKFLFRFRDGQEAETVYIPDREEDRGAVCLSSQVGCTLTCRFCHTGTQRLTRNLSAGEIIGQFMAARDSYDDWPNPKKPPDAPRLLSTIVLMGMGEPLYNYANVARAMTIAMDPEGIALSRRRITLSTSGVVPMMDRVGAELGVNLAVSLHAVRDELRDELVPLNRKYNIASLIAACRRFPSASNTRRITFEYVMLKGINDSERDANDLVTLIAGLPAKVNLIPFNPWPGSAYVSSSNAALARFARIVNDAGFSAPVRTPRGQDILAACGQLKTAQTPPRAKASTPN
jgi:23S rRNA (adenine2503-C2)-methyltransferase